MKSNPVLYEWLKLNSKWRDAFEKAKECQHLIDVKIKHYLDGLGKKPSEEDFAEALNNWKDETSCRTKLQEFYSLYGLFPTK
jgi:hypothetical protein